MRQILNEDEIERRVEKMTDHIDRQFTSGQITQKDYDAAMGELNSWAERKLRGG